MVVCGWVSSGVGIGMVTSDYMRIADAPPKVLGLVATAICSESRWADGDVEVCVCRAGGK